MLIQVTEGEATELLACVRLALEAGHQQKEIKNLERKLWTEIYGRKKQKHPRKVETHEQASARIKRAWETRRRNAAGMDEADGRVLGVGPQRQADSQDGERSGVPDSGEERGDSDGGRQAESSNQVLVAGPDSVGLGVKMEDKMDIHAFIQKAQEAKELLPWEVNPDLRECPLCREYKDKSVVTTSEGPSGNTYSCDCCHADIIKFWEEQEEESNG